MHLKSLAGRVAGYGNRQDGTRNSKIGEKSRGKYKSRSNADQEPGVLSVRPGEIAVPRHEAQSLDHHRCAPPQGSHRATHEGPDPDSSAPRTEIALAENGEASLGKGPTLELVWQNIRHIISPFLKNSTSLKRLDFSHFQPAYAGSESISPRCPLVL